ncbi:MAG: molybdenum ABC transporter ATP-binding protein [Rhizobiales bacterium]|nr:molybdenum ABC transporter ATP-binding protein [Hyphomicrobiales bacterium]NRB15920.1 molybdenum ABC transporter ATP-binding protein [Hyphomicrobiales bacterium]
MQQAKPEIKLKLKHAQKPNGFSLDIDISLPSHGVSAIFGASGSGKTSLLRCIAGLEKADHGHIQLNETIWQSSQSGIFVPPYKRAIGYIFQEASLFTHLTAGDNLQYAIKRAAKFGGQPKNNIDYKALISLMGIEPILNQYPAQLSGGERQRVAMARALLSQPQLLLMDEPLAALDYERKREILPYLERIRDDYKIPIIYVSHAIDEVARLADHLVVLDQGRVTHQGKLADVLGQIEPPLALGEDVGIVLHARLRMRDLDWHLVELAFDGGALWTADDGDRLNAKIRLRILARDVSLTKQASAKTTSILNSLPAKITAIVPDQHKAFALVQLKVGNSVILARVTAKSAALLDLKLGDNVWANVKSVSIIR